MNSLFNETLNLSLNKVFCLLYFVSFLYISIYLPLNRRFKNLQSLEGKTTQFYIQPKIYKEGNPGKQS